MNESADRTPTITAYPNGPLLVRGDVTVMSPQGRPVPRTRRTMALCRCGASEIKPFCDGSHKAIGFSTADAITDEPGGQEQT